MAGKRKSLSKKVRFDVFKRDGFICQYCGNHPPTVILEVDHIDPVALGGSNDGDNLLTSCFDCNRGKSCVPLNIAPDTVSKKAEVLEEKELQIKAYRKLIKANRSRLTRDVRKVCKVFEEFNDGTTLSATSKASIKSCFLPKLDVDEVESAMEKACLKVTDPERVFKYFYGICWLKIKDGASQ